MKWFHYYCKTCDLNFATDYEFDDHPYCPSCGLDEDTHRMEDEDEAEY